jgi:hypothetical protein
LVLGWLCQLFPNVRDALTIVRPETVVRWHRAGFRSYWRWKSSRRAGRPALPADVRYLIREISIANPLWGASRIHGGLLKLGHRRGQTSVAKYLTRRRAPRLKDGRPFSAIMPTGSLRWTCSSYYNATRTHLTLGKDAPIGRAAQHVGCIKCRPVLGGLHHQYVRI